MAAKRSNTVWEKGRIEIGKYANYNFSSEMQNKTIIIIIIIIINYKELILLIYDSGHSYFN